MIIIIIIIIIITVMIIIINKCENWNFGNWKSNSEIGKLEFRKLWIKFRNWNFEELFKNGILKIDK